MALVHGFAGLRDPNGAALHFTPCLPAEWDGMSFRITVRGSRLEVHMTHETTTYRLLDGPPVALTSDGHHLTVIADEAATLPVRPRDLSPI